MVGSEQWPVRPLVICCVLGGWYYSVLSIYRDSNKSRNQDPGYTPNQDIMLSRWRCGSITDHPGVWVLRHPQSWWLWPPGSSAKSPHRRGDNGKVVVSGVSEWPSGPISEGSSHFMGFLSLSLPPKDPILGGQKATTPWHDSARLCRCCARGQSDDLIGLLLEPIQVCLGFHAQHFWDLTTYKDSHQRWDVPNIGSLDPGTHGSWAEWKLYDSLYWIDLRFLMRLREVPDCADFDFFWFTKYAKMQNWHLKDLHPNFQWTHWVSMERRNVNEPVPKQSFGNLIHFRSF